MSDASDVPSVDTLARQQLIVTARDGLISITIEERGFLQALPQLGVMYIEVHPAYRRRGIGEYLLRQYIQLIRNKTKLQCITFTCDGQNEAALRLYTKLGFTLTSGETTSSIGDIVCRMDLKHQPTRALLPPDGGGGGSLV